MKIGLNTDSLGGLSLDAALDAAQRLGIASVEFPTGAWSSAPHVDLDRLLESEAARDELLGRVRDRGLSISSLTCNGNQLDPVGGPAHDEVTRKTIAPAPLLGVDRVVLMSGLPGGPGDRFANWIVVAWPPEAQAVLEHQWRVVTEYWQGLVRHAEDHGGVRLCIVDKGVGFCLDSAQKTGLGLVSMKERVQIVHGRIEIKSVPTVGTAIRITLPVNGKEQESVNTNEQSKAHSAAG